MHARAHEFDQLLRFPAANFRNAERAGALPQNRISGLNDFQLREIHNFRSLPRKK
jgi:hypothetical protein